MVEESHKKDANHSGSGEDLRNRAEARKFDLEAEEIEKRLSRHWLSPVSVMQAILGGVIAAGLLTAWFIVYLQPLLSAKSELANVAAQLHKTKAENLEILRKDLEARAVQLSAEKSGVQIQLDAMIVQNAELEDQQRLIEARLQEAQTQQSQLSAESEQLARRAELTLAERQRLERIAAESIKQLAELESQLQVLREAQASSSERATALTAQRSASLLGSYRIYIRKGPGEEEKANAIQGILRGVGVDSEIVEEDPPYYQNKLLTRANEDPRVVAEVQELLGNFELVHRGAYPEGGSPWFNIFP